MSKKLSTEQKEAEEFDGSADLGPVITRTVKKSAAKKAPAKKAEAAAPIESEQTLEGYLYECGVVVFTSEFIENLVLLFGLPVVMCFCKCVIVWAYSEANGEMVAFLASKYAELRNRHESLRKAEEEE